MSATILSHYVSVASSLATLLNVHLTVHPGNMDPFTSNVWAIDHADEGQAFLCLGDQINIPENDGAGCLLFAIVLPPRHCPKEEYTLIYVLTGNELNLGQNRDEENSLVFKAMRCHLQVAQLVTCNHG